MSDKIEKFVKENRHLFDSEVPSEMVWKSVKSGLKQQKTRSNIIKINRRFMWAAAAILIFAVSVIFYQGGLIRSLKGDQADFAANNDGANAQWQMPVQLQELNDVYTQQVGFTLSKLQSFPEEQEELKSELGELDKEFELLKEELGSEISSEEVLAAMIENYRIKLDLLEITLEYFKRSEKIVEDENVTL